jgi:flagella basal body P-ring formation protein FlgA
MSGNSGCNAGLFFSTRRGLLATLSLVKLRPALALPLPLPLSLPRAASLVALVAMTGAGLGVGAVALAQTPTPGQVQAQAPGQGLPPDPTTAANPALPAADLARALALVRQAAVTRAPAGARIEAQLGTLDARLKLAPCRRAEPALAAGVPAWGRTRVALRCADGAVAWSVHLPVTVQVFAPALASRGPLVAGSVLSEADLVSVETEWSAQPTPPLSRAAEVAGRTLARNVSPGQPLLGSDLRRRQWFASGEPVLVVSSGPGFSITAEGEALGPGIEGERVRVQLLQRGAGGQNERGPVVTGRATAERRVEVSL